MQLSNGCMIDMRLLISGQNSRQLYVASVSNLADSRLFRRLCTAASNTYLAGDLTLASDSTISTIEYHRVFDGRLTRRCLIAVNVAATVESLVRKFVGYIASVMRSLIPSDSAIFLMMRFTQCARHRCLRTLAYFSVWQIFPQVNMQLLAESLASELILFAAISEIDSIMVNSIANELCLIIGTSSQQMKHCLPPVIVATTPKSDLWQLSVQWSNSIAILQSS